MDRKGFAAVEAVLIAVVVLIAVGTGYYVYQADKKATDTLNSAAKSAKSSPPKNDKNTSRSAKTSASNQPATESKAPADSQTPAAGSCFTSASSIVTITINPDVPSPRCSKVSASQTLVLVNGTDKTVTAKLGSKSLSIAAGQSGTIDDKFGNYLQTGVHIITTSAYGGGSGPEVWLQ